MTACDEIQQVSTGGSVDLMQVDFDSLASVRRFSGEFQSRYTRRHMLIHNNADVDLSMNLKAVLFKIVLKPSLPRITCSLSCSPGCRSIC